MTDRLITTDLNAHWRAMRGQDPSKIARVHVEGLRDNNYAPTSSVQSNWGSYNGFNKQASSSQGILYGQPTFFSPVHTNINWQIPSKRLEQNQWARHFYENEPKVAAGIDFYSRFPMQDWTHECKDRKVKIHFDKLKKRIELPKWCRLISHEVHLLGDCFPFVELSCPTCNGTGYIGDELCDHKGGTINRLIILNPDYIDVEGSPFAGEPVIMFKPDPEFLSMIQKKLPGVEKIDPKMLKRMMSGHPIRLHNETVSHIKYGESGYSKFGTGMIRRLFPTLAYKTKLMAAQWVVAERLIVPIKVVKVGTDERPAGPADIADVQAQLASTTSDPSLTIVTHNAFDIDFIGASGKILPLSSEFELINQEILDGLMINKAIINGEGTSAGAAVPGLEAMIVRFETFREQISQWIEKFIYLPEAKRQGFIAKNRDTGEDEYIIPTIKWPELHLRDEQQKRQSDMQLYEKGLLSAQTVLENFGYNADNEIEKKRYDAIQLMAGQEQQGGGGGGGGMPGGGGGGGGMPPDMGGGGGGMPPDMGGGMPGGGGGGGDDGGGGGGAPPIVAKSTSLNSKTVDPSQFNGRILKERSREKIINQQKKMHAEKIREQKRQQGPQKGADGQFRDEKGRIVYTKPEREMLKLLEQSKRDGILKQRIEAQYRIKVGTQEYPIDFAIPSIKLGIEVDGEFFHTHQEKQVKDKERDAKLALQGWTILRYTDKELEENPQEVIKGVIAMIMKKEMEFQNAMKHYKKTASIITEQTNEMTEEDIAESSNLLDILDLLNNN